MSISVRPIADGDFFTWLDLYAAYGSFYETEITDIKALTVWSWLVDPNHEQSGVVAIDDANDGTMVGLAHFREFARPLASKRGLYVDDLFVAEDARGNGAGAALLDHLKQAATDRGLSVVRWITASDNETAIALYDQKARRTDWVTYDMDLA